MMRNRFFVFVTILAILGALPFAWSAGGESARRSAAAQGQAAGPPRASSQFVLASHTLQPRQPLAKMNPTDVRLTDIHSGRLFVKFHDEVQARRQASPGRAARAVVSRTGMDLSPFQNIVAQNDLTIHPAFSIPEDRINELLTRAAVRSGRAQPDLLGTMLISGPRHVMEKVAQEILALPEVEYVEFEEDYSDAIAEVLRRQEAGVDPVRGEVAADVAERRRAETGLSMLDAPRTVPNTTPAQTNPTPVSSRGTIEGQGSADLRPAVAPRQAPSNVSVAAGRTVTQPSMIQERQPPRRPHDRDEGMGGVILVGGACCVEGACHKAADADACDAANGDYFGDGTTCDDFSPPAGNFCIPGACCVGETCNEVLPIVCSQGGGEFFGSFTTCAQATCEEGACCRGINDCIIASEFACNALSPPGVYNEPGTTCDDPDTCNPGACCIEDESCLDVYQFVCDNAPNYIPGLDGPGFFRGPHGTPCSAYPPDECNIRACCLPPDSGPLPVDGSCEDLVRGQCAIVGGTFAPDGIGVDVTCDNDFVCCTDPGCFPTGSCFLWGNPMPNGMPALVPPNCFDACLGCCTQDWVAEFICGFDPFCCDSSINWLPGLGTLGRGLGHWDDICTWHVIGQRCQFDPRAPFHPCLAVPIGQDCFSGTGLPGCEIPGCCISVCSDPNFAYCCDNFWDAGCALRANQLCTDGLGNQMSLQFPQFYNPNAPTPNFVPAQAYLTPAGFGTHDLFGNPIPADLAFPLAFRNTINNNTHRPIQGWGGEGYDLETFWNYMADVFNTTGNPHGANVNNVRGHGTRIAVLYPTAFIGTWAGNDVTHESLIDPNDPQRIRYAEPNQTQLLLPNWPSELLDGNIGTAVLGLIGAPENGTGPFWNPASTGEWGIVGMAPQAEVLFFPTVSVQEGSRLQNAILSAIEQLDIGDVMVIPYVTRLVNFNNWASTPTVHPLLALATDLGISTVIPAGGPMVLPLSPQFDGEDSGVIVVGGVSPGQPFYRWNSRFCSGDPCPNESAIHFAGWSELVVTAGFGDLFVGNDAGGVPDLRRTYTNTFGLLGTFEGTAAAAAQVAANVANLQGFARAFYNTALSPQQVRAELVWNGWCQWGYCLGGGAAPQPPGSTGLDAVWGDWLYGGAPRRVGSISELWPQGGLELFATGVFADLQATGESILTTGYFDACDYLESVEVIRGTRVSGILFSICAEDAIYYIADSEFTHAGSTPGTKGGPANQATYVATGQIVDYLVTAIAPVGPVSALNITATGNAPGNQVVTFLELYDWQAGQWMIVAAALDSSVSASAFSPNRFVQPTTRRIYSRVWVYGFGGSPSFGDSPGQEPFRYRLDHVDISFEPVAEP